MISEDFFAGDDWIVYFYVCGNCILNHCSEIVLADFVVCPNIFYLNVVYDEISLDGNIARNYLVGFR